MKYNIGQLNAIDYMSNFIEKNPAKDDDYFMTLVGFAGTGKSTITQAIVNKYKFKKKIVVSAPTHPAKEIIGDITKQNSETIQALLGLRPDVDMDRFNPNKPVFGFKAEQKIIFLIKTTPYKSNSRSEKFKFAFCFYIFLEIL
jgi:replication-associated recombination protein RarA